MPKFRNFIPSFLKKKKEEPKVQKVFHSYRSDANYSLIERILCNGTVLKVVRPEGEIEVFASDKAVTVTYPKSMENVIGEDLGFIVQEADLDKRGAILDGQFLPEHYTQLVKQLKSALGYLAEGEYIDQISEAMATGITKAMVRADEGITRRSSHFIRNMDRVRHKLTREIETTVSGLTGKLKNIDTQAIVDVTAALIEAKQSTYKLKGSIGSSKREIFDSSKALTEAKEDITIIIDQIRKARLCELGKPEVVVGGTYEGTVTGFNPDYKGIYVKLDTGEQGTVHIKEISSEVGHIDGSLLPHLFYMQKSKVPVKFIRISGTSHMWFSIKDARKDFKEEIGYTDVRPSDLQVAYQKRGYVEKPIIPISKHSG